MLYAKPLDEEILHSIGSKYNQIITVEDGAIRGGVGQAITAFMNKNGYSTRVTTLGADDEFVEHGSLAELYAQCGYDTEAIYNKTKKILGI